MSPPYASLAIISGVYLLVMTAYTALEILQSSINIKKGLFSISVLYFCKFLSCFWSPLLVRLITAKWTIVLCIVPHTLFIISNFFGKWGTLMPAAALLGLVTGPFWTTQGVYVTALSIDQSKNSGEAVSGSLSHFNGIFFTVMSSVLIFGNLISSVILQNVPESSKNSTILGVGCGAQYCKADSVERQESGPKLEDLKLFLLIGCFLAINLLGLLLAIFGLKHVERRNEGNETSTPIKHIIRHQIISIFKMIGSKDFIPLIPMSILLALPLALLGSAYAEAYIACAIGVDKVGYVIMANGFLAVISSYTSGYLGKWLHRDIQFATSFIVLFSMMIAWFCWKPQTHHPYVIFFLIGGLGTLGQHAYHTQLNALIGRLFRKGQTAAAFASSHLFQGLASSTLYFIAGWTGCIAAQLYLTTAILLLSCIAYAWLTINIRRNGFNNADVQEEEVQGNVKGSESLMHKSILKAEPLSVERSKLTNTENEIAS